MTDTPYTLEHLDTRLNVYMQSSNGHSDWRITYKPDGGDPVVLADLPLHAVAMDIHRLLVELALLLPSHTTAPGNVFTCVGLNRSMTPPTYTTDAIEAPVRVQHTPSGELTMWFSNNHGVAKVRLDIATKMLAVMAEANAKNAEPPEFGVYLSDGENLSRPINFPGDRGIDDILCWTFNKDNNGLEIQWTDGNSSWRRVYVLPFGTFTRPVALYDADSDARIVARWFGMTPDGSLQVMPPGFGNTYSNADDKQKYGPDWTNLVSPAVATKWLKVLYDNS